MYIVLDSMYVTMSISTGLNPKLDLWNVNKLHYICNHLVLFKCEILFFMVVYNSVREVKFAGAHVCTAHQT